MYENVLVAVDGTERDRGAVEYAVDAASEDGATVHAISVVDTFRFGDHGFCSGDVATVSVEEHAAECLGHVADRADRVDLDCVEKLVRGHPDGEVSRYASEVDADLVVVGGPLSERHRRRWATLLDPRTEFVVAGSKGKALSVAEAHGGEPIQIATSDGGTVPSDPPDDDGSGSEDAVRSQGTSTPEADLGGGPSTDETRWDDPERCPFCGGGLEDGGPGFISHIRTSPECAAAFGTWREQVADDIGGEWSG
jgi:nucleotide-binding universal stress UspA family protein